MGRRRNRTLPLAGEWDGAGEAKGQDFVTALARGLELLRAFGPDDEYLSNGELSERTGIPKPSVSRLTNTLTVLGYLRYSQRLEKYRLGVAVLGLGYRYLATLGCREVARPFMQSLANLTNCAVAMGTADRLEITLLELCQGSGPMVWRADVGVRLPIQTTAMGRAWLAGIPERSREIMLQRIREDDPARWPRIAEALDGALRDFQRFGFCIAEGEWEAELSAVAVPLALEGGSRVLSFSCTGSSIRLTRRVLEETLGPRLVDLVRRVRTSLTGD